MRVVASLTTMPDNYKKLEKTISYLKEQTYPLDEIYLSLPYKSKRLDIEYPEPSDYIKNNCKIVRCEDYGPITKIYAGLVSEHDPNTSIITFDDDMYYPSVIVEKLVEHSKFYKNSAIGSSGMLLKYNCPMCAIYPNIKGMKYNIANFYISKKGRNIDSLYGLAGVLYRRKFFPSNENLYKDFLSYAFYNDDMFLNDDITISGYLSLKNIKRRIFSDIPSVDFIYEEDTGLRKRFSYELSYNLDNFLNSMNSAIETSKKIGMFKHTEKMSCKDTIVANSLLPIIVILTIICLTLYLINFKFV